MKKMIFAMVVVGLFISASARTEEAADEKILSLQKRIEALEKTNISRGSNIASAVSKAEAVQTEFAAVKGAVDSNSHMIGALNEQMQNLYRDLERRVQAMEDQLRLVNDMLKKGGTASSKATDEYLEYQAAIEKMNESDYLDGAKAFQQFQKDYPRSKMAAHAQFHVGECYFLARDYQQSIKQFQVYIEKNPRGEKVADAMVMQGSAFVELGMIEEARAFFTKVSKDYPKSNAAQRAQAKVEMLNTRGTMTADNHKAQFSKDVTLDYPEETIEQRRSSQKTIMEQSVKPQSTTTAPQTKPVPAPKETERNYMEF